MKKQNEGASRQPEPPPGTRGHVLEVGADTLVVLSMPAEPPTLERTTLTKAEVEVVGLVVQNLSNAEIAARRGTSARTVANQMASIFRKLDVNCRRDLVARYRRATLIAKA